MRVIRPYLEPDPPLIAARQRPSLAADLQAVADGAPLRFSREPEPSKTLRRAWRNRRVLASAMGLLALVAAVFTVQTAVLKREATARRDLDAGVRSASAGEFAAASAQFAMAFDRASAGGSQALRLLATEANRRGNEALAAGRVRDRAQAFFLKIEPIRFRLITGHGLKSASRELHDAFAEFKVFGPIPWTQDTELGWLDAARPAFPADRGGE